MSRRRRSSRSQGSSKGIDRPRQRWRRPTSPGRRRPPGSRWWPRHPCTYPGCGPGWPGGSGGRPHGGVGDKKLFLPQDPVPHRLGPLGVQELLESVRAHAGDLGEAGRVVHLLPGGGVVDHDVADVLEDLVALSLGSAILKSSGVSSMNLVWHFPARKVGWLRMLPMKAMLVFTPRTRVSPGRGWPWRRRLQSCCPRR